MISHVNTRNYAQLEINGGGDNAPVASALKLNHTRTRQLATRASDDSDVLRPRGQAGMSTHLAANVWPTRHRGPFVIVPAGRAGPKLVWRRWRQSEVARVASLWAMCARGATHSVRLGVAASN